MGAGVLVLGQPRVLGNKRLVSFLVVSGVLVLMTLVLQSVPPRSLVSITDAIAAIVTCIVAVVWGALMLVGAVIALVKRIGAARGAGLAVREREAGSPA